MSVIDADKCDHHPEMVYGNPILKLYYCLDCETWLEKEKEEE